MGKLLSKIKMPSKGVQVYTYISAPGAVQIELEVPKRTGTVRDQGRFETDNYEVDSAAIRWPLKTTGKFVFRVRKDGDVVTEQHIEVDPITGDVRSSSTMDDTLLETRSIRDRDLVVCYGSYEAGPGKVGLPNRHQCYVSVTRDFSDWMAMVAPRGGDEEKKPFNHLVLPAPHDVGMNSMDTMNAILKHAGVAGSTILAEMMPFLGGAKDGIAKVLQGLSDVTVSNIAPDIIASLSITQKDTVSTLCAIGARYFEFRPAHCHSALLPHSPLPDKLYFQHGPIPGMAYDQFLSELVLFLTEHTAEVAVVHVRWDGVPAECRRPDDAELRSYLDAALALSRGTVRAGGVDDLRGGRTLQELRDEGRRLVYVQDDGGVLSTYDDDANATTAGDKILRAFERVLTRENQEGRTMTLVQCQATPTNIKDVIYYSVATAEASSMVLMATKAQCGHLLLPWLRDNLAGRCRNDQLVVLMDDFLDGSATDVAVGLCRERLR
jgi:hypothetical protein